MFDALTAELAQWKELGALPHFWIRDDDVQDVTDELYRLLRVAERFGRKIALAVIPSGTTDRLVNLLRGSAFAIAWQHGNRHLWQDPDRDYSRGEFGIGRDLDALAADACAGKRAMDKAFGQDGWEKVFVPPFHALDPEFKALLPALGYIGLSAGNPPTPKLLTVKEANAAIDLMNWKQRRFAGADKIVAQVVDELRLQRARPRQFREPIGILTHHLAFDEACWEFLDLFLTYVSDSDSCDLLSADEMFAPPSQSAKHECQDTVALVITSCGRQDLLERTLKSFFATNEYPLNEIIVIEDGDGKLNGHLESVFKSQKIRWLQTGSRVGQIKAIDCAYQACTSDYIFHCEDDWEFFQTGYLSKSLTLLKHHPWLLQVWIRSLRDTNKHPLLKLECTTAGIPFRLLSPNHDAEPWGQWHGFSWNPGLRRRDDYEKLGSFALLDPEGSKETWRVESEASKFYKHSGFLAAILADNSGDGYVRHIGKERRVSRHW